MKKRGRPRVDPAERFWPNVEKTDECWIWKGGANKRGYGSFFDGVWNVRAHRYSYELAIGPIPPGLHLDHLCRNTRCVRPDHLEPVTGEENHRRGRAAREEARLKKWAEFAESAGPPPARTDRNSRRENAAFNEST